MLHSDRFVASAFGATTFKEINELDDGKVQLPNKDIDRLLTWSDSRQDAAFIDIKQTADISIARTIHT